MSARLSAAPGGGAGGAGAHRGDSDHGGHGGYKGYRDDQVPSSVPTAGDLTNALWAYEQGNLSGGALCTAFRAACGAWPGLPPRFAPVLETLLQPLESSALFSEESCAFSRHDLAASLRPWLDAALQRAPWPATGTSATTPNGGSAPGKDPAG